MTLDDLIALNDEIAALVRAGVPLELGLAELGGDLPGRLGQFATELAQRTARGESLAQAVAGDAGKLPKVYQAVVEAGVRAGRLPTALEAVASSARRLSDTYRFTAITAMYPLLVILVAWCGLLFFSCVLAPGLAAMFMEFNAPGQRFFAALAQAGQSAWYWGPIVPVAFVLLTVVWWLGHTDSRWTEQFLAWMPWTRRILRDLRAATFCEILALLVENQTPLPEAVVLAGEASGDPPTSQIARQMAEAIRNGQVRPVAGCPVFPPLVRWLLSAAGRDGALLPSLRHAASFYHRRARHQSDLQRVFLPVFLTIGIGGTVTALYALAFFIPYTSMLRSLAG
ncbi:MAG: type II secretion system F family protein [Pirellulales bacterium]|nr:type II secretion system F family protein [Pirellulales bacterium]